MERSDWASLWHRLRNDLTFRSATVFAGASWFVIEAADTLGASTSVIRGMALGLALLFVIIVPIIWLRERSVRRNRVHGDPDMHWGVGVARRPRSRRGTRRWLAATTTLVVLAVGLWVFRTRLMAAGPVPDAATRMAVLPFHATGTGDVRELGVGMADLLTTALDDVGGISMVSSRTVLARVNRGDEDLTQERSLEIGRTLDAGSILTGSITGAGAAVRLTAEIREVDAGGVLARAEVDGPQDSILTLTDRLAVQLLRELWRSRSPLPTVRVSALTTTSPVALREYLRGEDHLRGLRLDSAADAYRRALAVDSTFALAWLRLSDATGWSFGGNLEDGVVRREYTSRALALAERLPARERAFVRAQHLAVEGKFEGIDSLQRYVERYPDDPVAWYHLGDARFHSADYGRVDNDEIVAPFVEATRLDPALGIGLVHVLDMAIERNDRALFDSLMHHYTRVAPARLAASRRRQADVRWSHPDSTVAVFIDHARRLHPIEERWAINDLVGALGRKARLNPDTDPYVYVSALDSLARVFRTDGYWQSRTRQLRAIALGTLGAVDRAFAEIDQSPEVGPPNLPPAARAAFMKVVMALDGDAPHSAVEQSLQLLEQHASTEPVPTILHVYHLKRGEDERAARYTMAPPPPSGDVDTAAVRMIFEGWLGLMRGEQTAVDSIDAGVDRLGFARPANGLPLIDYARGLARIPARREQAERMLRGHIAHAASNTGDAWLELARLLDAKGDAAGAREAYGHVLRFFHGADPFRQPARDEASAALARLRER